MYRPELRITKFCIQTTTYCTKNLFFGTLHRHIFDNNTPTNVAYCRTFLLTLSCKSAGFATNLFSESVSLILDSKIWRFSENKDRQYRTFITVYSFCIGSRCNCYSVWGIVYLFSGAAKCLLSDKRTTPHFLYFIPIMKTHRSGVDTVTKLLCYGVTRRNK